MELIQKLADQKTAWSREEQSEAFKSVYQKNREGQPEEITVKSFVKNLNRIKK